MECCAVCINCGDTIEPGEQARTIRSRRLGVFFVCASCEEAVNRRSLRFEAMMKRTQKLPNAADMMEILLNGWADDCERVVVQVPPLMELTREVLT